MFLNKIEDNQKGHSAINFVVIMFMVICLCCAILDLTNMVRVKSVVNQQANTCAFAATLQGGFKNVEPTDWKQFYGTDKYLTSPEIIQQQKELFGKTNALSWKTVIKTSSLGTQTISNASNITIPWKEEGILTVEANYQFQYLNMFGLINNIYKYSKSQDIIGFWVHKTTHI